MSSQKMDIEYYIAKNIPWNRLPPEIQSLIDNQDEYGKKIKEYSIQNQLRYKDNLIRHVEKNQRLYYEQLLRFSREHYMLFPYHLSEYLINGMRITPFQYYQTIFIQMIEQEKNYDTLPNFTAADCFRLMGIGRNQYIDIMNQYKSSKKFLGMIKKPIKELLPTKPVENLFIDFWWTIRPGYITEDDIKSMVTPAEKIVIDIIVNDLKKSFPAGNFPHDVVLSLYMKGLIYFDLIIDDNDLIYIPPLEGFVMNRITGDYFEKLLYKIFVSIDEKTTIVELSEVLKIDLNLVKNAISMYCRLGFAFKKNNDLNVNNCHDSWLKHMSSSPSTMNPSNLTASPLNQQKTFDLKENFIDSLNMMDETASIASLSITTEPNDNQKRCSDDASINDATIASPSVSSPLPSSNDNQKRIALLYDSTLAAFLMMGNLSPGLKSHAVTMFEVGKLSDESMDNFITELSKIEAFNNEEYGEGGEAERYFLHAMVLSKTIQFLRNNFELTKDLIINNSNTNEDPLKGLGLDLIRCESLLNLDSESCKRLLMRNYEFIISIAPLNEMKIFSMDLSIAYFGSLSSIVNSIWFKIFLYSITRSGPISFLIPKGERITCLPEILYNYDYLLIQPWGRDSTIVTISNALIAINETIIFNPILLQTYPSALNAPNLPNHSASRMSKDNQRHQHQQQLYYLPLPLLDKDVADDQQPSNDIHDQLCRHRAIESLRKYINLDRVCGYLTFINFNTSNDIQDDDWCLFDCHFGIPLFDSELNGEICKRIHANRLFDREKLKDSIESNRRLLNEIYLFIEKNIDDHHQINQNNDKILRNYQQQQQQSINKNQSMISYPSKCLYLNDDGHLNRFILK